MNNYQIVKRDEYDEFGKIDLSVFLIKKHKKFLFWDYWEYLCRRDEYVMLGTKEQAEEYIKNINLRGIIIETHIQFVRGE